MRRNGWLTLCAACQFRERCRSNFQFCETTRMCYRNTRLFGVLFVPLGTRSGTPIRPSWLPLDPKLLVAEPVAVEAIAQTDREPDGRDGTVAQALRI
jgi:hypothetical protein